MSLVVEIVVLDEDEISEKITIQCMYDKMVQCKDLLRQQVTPTRKFKFTVYSDKKNVTEIIK